MSDSYLNFISMIGARRPMTESHFEEPPPLFRVFAVLVSCMLLAAFLHVGVESLVERTVLHFSPKPGYLPGALLKLFVAGALCFLTLRTSGLGLGDRLGWQRHWKAILVLCVIPPLVSLAVYPNFTSRPFYGASSGFWLLLPLAEELLFTGFIYGQMTTVFGKPSQSWQGAFGSAPLITASLFSIYHWSDLRFSDGASIFGFSYASLQMIYALFSSLLMMNIRRWTDSIWPAVLSHIAVNALMSFI